MRNGAPILQIEDKKKGSVMTGWLYVAGGIAFIIFGLVIFFKGGFHNWGAYVPVTKATAVIVMLFGAYMMRAGYKKVICNDPEPDECLKCTGCGEVFAVHEVPGRKCTRCAGEVEKIEGFFERHPEFRDQKDQNKPGTQ